jgi:hypothetical protein
MSKHTRRGKAKIYFVPTLTSLTSPSIAEIVAGTHLGKGLRTMSGFETQVSRISEAVMDSNVSPQITGEQTFGDAQMVLLEDDGGTTDPDHTELAAAYSALADGAQGYIVAAPYGLTATKKAEVWSVSIGANNRQWTTDNEMAKYSVAFAPLTAPNKNATLAT